MWLGRHETSRELQLHRFDGSSRTKSARALESFSPFYEDLLQALS